LEYDFESEKNESLTKWYLKGEILKKTSKLEETKLIIRMKKKKILMNQKERNIKYW